MRVVRASVLTLALALPFGASCATTQINRLPETHPLSQPREIAAEGTYDHVPSHYRFPPQVNAFTRVGITQFDSAALDVSVGYNSSPMLACPVAMTIYLAPTPRMSFVGAAPEVVASLEADWLEHEFRRVQKEIMHAHPAATLEGEHPADGGPGPGREAVYTFEDKRSELRLFVVGHAWFLKYRITYPAYCADGAANEVAAFVAEWKGTD